MAYATIEDLEARWHPLGESERARASVLLDDAAVYIDSLIDCDAHILDQALVIVSCNMVMRSMIAAEGSAYGVKQETISADIYSQSLSYANPNGDLYLTAQEKRLLGVTGSYLTSMRPSITPTKVRRHEDTWRDR